MATTNMPHQPSKDNQPPTPEQVKESKLPNPNSPGPRLGTENDNSPNQPNTAHKHRTT